MGLHGKGAEPPHRPSHRGAEWQFAPVGAPCRPQTYVSLLEDGSVGAGRTRGGRDWCSFLFLVLPQTSGIHAVQTHSLSGPSLMGTTTRPDNNKGAGIVWIHHLQVSFFFFLNPNIQSLVHFCSVHSLLLLKHPSTSFTHTILSFVSGNIS